MIAGPSGDGLVRNPSKIGVDDPSILDGDASKADNEDGRGGVARRSEGDTAVQEEEWRAQAGLRHRGRIADGRRARDAPAMAWSDAIPDGGIACIEAEEGAC